MQSLVSRAHSFRRPLSLTQLRRDFPKACLFDIHGHVRQLRGEGGSIDAGISVTDFFDTAERYHLSVVASTDHNDARAHARFAKVAQKRKIIPLLGVEVTTSWPEWQWRFFTPHVVLLNVKPEEFCELIPQATLASFIFPIPIDRLFAWIQKHPKVIVIIPHPYVDQLWTLKMYKKRTTCLTLPMIETLAAKYPGCIHGMEIMNEKPDAFVLERLRFAKRFGLTPLAGSDVHQNSAEKNYLGLVGNWMPKEIRSAEEVYKAIRTNTIGGTFYDDARLELPEQMGK